MVLKIHDPVELRQGDDLVVVAENVRQTIRAPLIPVLGPDLRDTPQAG